MVNTKQWITKFSRVTRVTTLVHNASHSVTMKQSYVHQGCTNFPKKHVSLYLRYYKEWYVAKFRSLDPQVRVTLQNSVARATWRLGFVHPWIWSHNVEVPLKKITRCNTVFRKLIALIHAYSTVRCFVFGLWKTLRSWRTSLLGVVKWWGVGPYWLGTSVWQGQLYLGDGQETLDQTWRCISDSLLAYSFKIPTAKNRALHYTSGASVKLSLCTHSLTSVLNRVKWSA
jgi:hypothetical protein